MSFKNSSGHIIVVSTRREGGVDNLVRRARVGYHTFCRDVQSVVGVFLGLVACLDRCCRFLIFLPPPPAVHARRSNSVAPEYVQYFDDLDVQQTRGKIASAWQRKGCD